MIGLGRLRAFLLDIAVQTQGSLEDDLILQAAVEGNAVYLLMEDVAHGANLCGVEIGNPFK